MSESKATGKVRRAIVRSDEGEVRARVALALGGSASIRWYVGNDEVEICARADFPRSPTPEDVAALAAVGIFPGRDGWEIEAAPAVAVRRPLPAPWAWRSVNGYVFLSRSDDRTKAIAFARETECDVYQGEDVMSYDKQIPVASLAEARERAEDECWARGLFGVSDAPPADIHETFHRDVAARNAEVPIATPPVASTPVDRAQAIRDALIERLTCSPLPPFDDVANMLNGGNGRPVATGNEIRAALASIGAVRDGYRWRLSVGTPPGWEWERTETRSALRRSAEPASMAIAMVERERGDWFWRTEPGEWTLIDSRGMGEPAALLACRRAGLFAPPVAAPTMADIPADDLDSIVPGGAQGGVVARARREAAAASPVQGPAVTLRRILDVVMDERTPFDGDALDGLCARFFGELDAAWDARMAGKPPVATTEPTDAHRDPVQAAASAMLQRDTIDPAWGALEARAVRAEQERDDARARVHDLERVILVRNNEVDHVTNCRDSARANAASWKARAEDAEGTVIAMRALLAKAAP